MIGRIAYGKGRQLGNVLRNRYRDLVRNLVANAVIRIGLELIAFNYILFNIRAFIDNRNRKRCLGFSIIYNFTLFVHFKFNGGLVNNVGVFSFNRLLDKAILA